jgi:hypothetical protein
MISPSSRSTQEPKGTRAALAEEEAKEKAEEAKEKAEEAMKEEAAAEAAKKRKKEPPFTEEEDYHLSSRGPSHVPSVAWHRATPACGTK